MNENYNPTSGGPNRRRKQGWGDFLENLKHQRDKVAWIVGILATVFTAGCFVGGFYENLMNKFTISELKAKHATELREQKDKYMEKEMERIYETQRKIDNSIINSLEIKRHEK